MTLNLLSIANMNLYTDVVDKSINVSVIDNFILRMTLL